MKLEDVDLLLKDLCDRVPYGVKCKYNDGVIVNVLSVNFFWGQIEGYERYVNCTLTYDAEDIKPYLFPISSITEEQWKEITDIQIQESLKSLDSIDDSVSNPLFSTDDLKTIEWCYANHIDIHNLIPMGLAIDATGLNIY